MKKKKLNNKVDDLLMENKRLRDEIIQYNNDIKVLISDDSSNKLPIQLKYSILFRMQEDLEKMIWSGYLNLHNK